MAERTASSSWRHAWLLVLLFAAGACQGTRLTAHQRELIENHIVTFDALGRPMNPETDIHGWEIGDQEMTPQHYEERVRLIMEHARAWLMKEPNRKVLVFIHGGLNTYGDTRDRILERAERMKDDGYYPIFVSWDSGLFGSYCDNLLYAEGRWSWFKFCMSPFAVVRDVVVGVLNIPPRATRFVCDLLQHGEGHGERTAASVALAHDAMRQPDHDDADSQATQAQRAAWEDRNRDEVDFEDLPLFEPPGFGGYYRYSRLSPHWLTLPVSLVTSLGYDAFGKGAWEEMIRRTKLLFDDVELSNVGSKRRLMGLSLLMRELGKLQDGLNSAPPKARRSTAKRAPSAARTPLVQLLDKVRSCLAPPVPSGDGDGKLMEDGSQRGLEILRQGLRRFLDKINDPRYQAEIDSIVAQISELRADWAVLWPVIVTRLSAGPEALDTDARAFKGVIETILRLMFAGEVSDLKEVADALYDATVDITEAVGESDNQKEILRKLLPVPGQLDRQRLELLVRGLLDYVEMRLAAVQRTEAGVVIFAHSMGTIIVNEILRRSAWFETPRFKDIVYMGAACSIREYEDSVFPYLRRNKHYLPQFHSLMLHPRAEDEEISGYEVFPRGSLLVYVDNYLTSPSTPHDRTLGQFANILLSLDRTQREIAGLIHMKVFSVGGPGQGLQQPEGHGEFTPARFWEPSFFRTKRQMRQIEKAKQGST